MFKSEVDEVTNPNASIWAELDIVPAGIEVTYDEVAACNELSLLFAEPVNVFNWLTSPEEVTNPKDSIWFELLTTPFGKPALIWAEPDTVPEGSCVDDDIIPEGSWADDEIVPAGAEVK